MGAYFGDPGQGSSSADTLSQLLPIFHEVRNRDLQDYEAKGRINQDLEIRQQRQRLMFDPNTGMGKTTNNEVSKGINNANPEMATAVKEDLTPQDKAKFGLEKSGQDIEKSKIAQQGKIGEERVGIQKAQEELNSTKNENIHNIKMDEQQRRHERDLQEMRTAYDKMSMNRESAAARLEFLEKSAAAAESRAAVTAGEHEATIRSLTALHDSQIARLNQQIEDAKNPKASTETTDVNADRTHKTVVKSKGESKAYDSNTTYRMKGKDGKAYMVSGKDMDKAKKDGLTEFPTTATGQ